MSAFVGTQVLLYVLIHFLLRTEALDVRLPHLGDIVLRCVDDHFILVLEGVLGVGAVPKFYSAYLYAACSSAGCLNPTTCDCFS